MKLHGIADVMGNPDIGIVTLLDKEEKILFPIVCDTNMKNEIHRRMVNDKNCKNKLPEVLSALLKPHLDSNVSIVIFNIKGGKYYAFIYGLTDIEAPHLLAADAVLLHIVSHIPIFITQKLLKKQAIPYVKGSPAMALPVNVLTDKMLKDALNHAVVQENYEMASRFRDELKSRGVE